VNLFLEFKNSDKKRLAKGFLLSLFFVFNFSVAIWDIQWILNNFESVFNQNALASVIGSNLIVDAYSSSKSDILAENSEQNKIKSTSVEEILNINVASAIAVKIKSDSQEVLFARNEKEKLPIASLTKLMTALVVLEDYNLDQEVIISENALKQEGVQGVLKVGEVLSVKNLLYISLIESSNRASYALSEVIGPDEFIGKMNETSQRIGLTNTRFVDSSGLDEGSYSTSEDLIKLTKYLYENYPLFGEIISLKSFNLYLPNGKLHHKLLNTNKFLGQIDGLLGGKTGWTSLAKGCFMIIIKDSQDKNYSIYVVLGAEDRFLEMGKIINLISNK